MTDKCACPLVDLWGEFPDFYHAEKPKARKQHKCCECGKTIEPGEIYERVASKYDGAVLTLKTCLVCAEIRETLFCEGFVHESMMDDLGEFVRECFDSLPWAKIREMSQPAQDVVLAMVQEEAEQIHEMNAEDGDAV